MGLSESPNIHAFREMPPPVGMAGGASEHSVCPGSGVIVSSFSIFSLFPYSFPSFIRSEGSFYFYFFRFPPIASFTPIGLESDDNEVTSLPSALPADGEVCAQCGSGTSFVCE